jgi:hypothetical protein
MPEVVDEIADGFTSNVDKILIENLAFSQGRMRDLLAILSTGSSVDPALRAKVYELLTQSVSFEKSVIQGATEMVVAIETLRNQVA